jgi:pimeloyl-ACP methyl ester carboxylesterase
MRTQNSPSTQYLERDGGRIAFDDSGSGLLIVCVPGMGEMRDEYRLLRPPLLEAGYRVVTMDVRGQGASSIGWADYSVGPIGGDILALIRHLHAGPASLVGNSMGCAAAVCAAADAPDLVAGLVLTGPVVRDGEGMPPWAARLLYNVLFARPWGVAAWGRYYATLYKTVRPADFSAYQARLLTNLREPGRLAALRQMMLAPKTASAARLSRVSAPTFVIMGTADPDFKDATAEARFVAGQTRGRLLLVPGAGHYPHVEVADEVNPAIVAFCREVAGHRAVAV